VSQEPTDFYALLADANKAGVSTLEFWEMTPRELNLAMEAASWRMQNEQMIAMSLAWHTAALTRAKRMPTLREMLNRIKPKKQIPVEQQRDDFERIKARVRDKLSVINKLSDRKHGR